MAALPKINLLPREGFEYTTPGRIFHWALTIGRAIVVLTELIVIVAFLSRFWLDRQLTNLNEKIKQQTAVIRASQKFEREFRQTQQKLTGFSQLAQQRNQAALLRQILRVVPPLVAVSQVIVDQQRLQITGLALTESELETFIAALERETIGEVVITQARVGTTDQTNGVHFTLDVTFPKQTKTSQAPGQERTP